MHPSEYIINIEKLSKSFDDNHVLKKIIKRFVSTKASPIL